MSRLCVECSDTRNRSRVLDLLRDGLVWVVWIMIVCNGRAPGVGPDCGRPSTTKAFLDHTAHPQVASLNLNRVVYCTHPSVVS